MYFFLWYIVITFDRTPKDKERKSSIPLIVTELSSAFLQITNLKSNENDNLISSTINLRKQNFFMANPMQSLFMWKRSSYYILNFILSKVFVSIGSTILTFFCLLVVLSFLYNSASSPKEVFFIIPFSLLFLSIFPVEIENFFLIYLLFLYSLAYFLILENLLLANSNWSLNSRFFSSAYTNPIIPNTSQIFLSSFIFLSVSSKSLAYFSS